MPQRTNNRRFRKRSRKAQIARLPGNTTTFTRKATFAIVKGAADSGRAVIVTLGDFTVSDITSLFGLYKIDTVKVTWRLVNAPNNNATFPTLHTAPQSYSLSAPTTLAEMQSLTGIKTYQFGPSHVSYTRVFKPAIIIDASSAAGTGQVNMPATWLTVFNTAVNHVVCSQWIQRYNSTSDATHTIEYDTEVVLSLKSTR